MQQRQANWRRTISSARMAFTPLCNMWDSQRRPSCWCGRSVAVICAGGPCTAGGGALPALGAAAAMRRMWVTVAWLTNGSSAVMWDSRNAARRGARAARATSMALLCSWRRISSGDSLVRRCVPPAPPLALPRFFTSTSRPACGASIGAWAPSSASKTLGSPDWRE